MRKNITISVILAALLASGPVVPSTRAQQAAPVCYEAVLALFIGTVFVIGVYKICKYAQQQDQNPDALPPDVSTNLPSGGPPGWIHPSPPPLALQYQLFGSYLTAQYHDGVSVAGTRDDGWQTAYRFQPQMGPSGLQIVAYDGNGVALATNSPTYSRDQWNVFDFTALPPSVTNEAPCRFFRLVGQQ